MPLRHVEEALGVPRASVSLNQTVGPDDDVELGDLVTDDEMEDRFNDAETSARDQGIRMALQALPERERRAVELRFGFDGDARTLDAVGRELDMTRERARQVIEQGLRRIGLALAA